MLLHIDAAQSVGKIPTKAADLGVDLLSVAGHKVYAPKGVGALYLRAGVELEPFLHGAGHEAGRWAGTENVLLIPGSALGVGAGALFGVVRGSVLVSVASTLGATCAFLLGRSLARDWVATRIEGNASFMALDRAIAAEGWKIVLLTRLSPLFPFTLLNYALSLMRVSLRHYVLASWMGMLPGTVMYVYLGSLARAGVEDRSRTAAEGTLYAVGLVATITVAVVVTRLAHRALANRTTTAS